MNWKKNHSIILCHLSFLKNIPPPIHILPYPNHEFSKPYRLLFLEFESFLKCDKHGWVGHAGIEWGEAYRGGVGYAEKQLKNDRPQNQEMTPPNSS